MSRKPTLFELYSQSPARKPARKPMRKAANPLVKCEKQSTSYNKYVAGGGAKFRFGGGQIRVRGCDSDKPKGKSAYNVMAWTDLPRRGLSKGAEFALPKSQIHGMRWRDQGNYSHIPETGRYALPPGRGGRGIFGVEGFKQSTTPGKKHNWKVFQNQPEVMRHSDEIKARLKRAKTKSGKVRIARESAVGAAVEKIVKAELVQAGVPAAAAAVAAKPVTVAAAESYAPGTQVKAAAQHVAQQMAELAPMISGASKAQQEKLMSDFGISIAKEVKSEVAPAAAAAKAKSKRLPRGKASSELVKAANPHKASSSSKPAFGSPAWRRKYLGR